MADVIVIGAGLYGSIIARNLRDYGADVLVIDGYMPRAGSKPAACLMRPQWFGGLSKTVVTDGLDVLNSLYRVQQIEFEARLHSQGKPIIRRVPINWIDPQEILLPPNLTGMVHSVISTPEHVDVLMRDGEEYEAKTVVVAAGVRSKLLVPGMPDIEAVAGMACLWQGMTTDKPFMAPWAPYKQLIGFNRGDGIWVSDGSTTTSPPTDKWLNAIVRRCRRAAGMSDTFPEPKQLIGYRPVVKHHKNGYVAERAPGVWVATGGAKNGTLLAAYAASVIAHHVV